MGCQGGTPSRVLLNPQPAIRQKRVTAAQLADIVGQISCPWTCGAGPKADGASGSLRSGATEGGRCVPGPNKAVAASSASPDSSQLATLFARGPPGGLEVLLDLQRIFQTGEDAGRPICPILELFPAKAPPALPVPQSLSDMRAQGNLSFVTWRDSEGTTARRSSATECTC